MALVLRKAVLPKNVTLWKCIRGRSLATTANKKHTTAISKAALCRSPKDERILPLGRSRFSRAKHLFEERGRRGDESRRHDVRFCVSCPDLVPDSRAKPHVPVRHFSPPRTRLIFKDPSYKKSSPVLICLQSCLNSGSKRAYSKCPCPHPCGPCGCPSGCGCLPPPCNTPPRCIQYMTGYYYYPYGTWFCGPYHVQNTCCPVGPSGCGPCPPCGPCGPCAKCCCCAAPTLAATIVTGGVPKEQPMSGIVPGNQIPYMPKENIETRQQQQQQQQQPQQPQYPQPYQPHKQKSQFPFNLNASAIPQQSISKAGLKKVSQPMVNASGPKNIATPRVVPPVMSATYATRPFGFNGSGCRYSSRFMSSDASRPTLVNSKLTLVNMNPTLVSTRPIFTAYEAPISGHVYSTPTSISAKTLTKGGSTNIPAAYTRRRGQTPSPIRHKREKYISSPSPFERSRRNETAPTPTELEYFAIYHYYKTPAISSWIFHSVKPAKA